MTTTFAVVAFRDRVTETVIYTFVLYYEYLVVSAYLEHACDRVRWSIVVRAHKHKNVTDDDRLFEAPLRDKRNRPSKTSCFVMFSRGGVAKR